MCKLLILVLVGLTTIPGKGFSSVANNLLSVRQQLQAQVGKLKGEIKELRTTLPGKELIQQGFQAQLNKIQGGIQVLNRKINKNSELKFKIKEIRREYLEVMREIKWHMNSEVKRKEAIRNLQKATIKKIEEALANSENVTPEEAQQLVKKKSYVKISKILGISGAALVSDYCATTGRKCAEAVSNNVKYGSPEAPVMPVVELEVEERELLFKDHLKAWLTDNMNGRVRQFDVVLALKRLAEWFNKDVPASVNHWLEENKEGRIPDYHWRRPIDNWINFVNSTMFLK